MSAEAQKEAAPRPGRRVRVIVFLAFTLLWCVVTVTVFGNLWGIRERVYGSRSLTVDTILHPPVWPALTLLLLALEPLLLRDRSESFGRKVLGVVGSLWPVGLALTLVEGAGVVAVCLIGVGLVAAPLDMALRRRTSACT